MIAITVSTNYDDILDIIMPQNAKFFKKWMIVTRSDDTATLDIIRKYNYPNVEVLFFDFTAGGTKFNKGGAIRYAQQQISKEYTGLVLILDSDIWLPDTFPEIMSSIKFHKFALYGAGERDDYYSYSHFINNIVDYAFPRHRQFRGFFQLYLHNPKLLYNNSQDCSVCDMLFIKLFGIRKKIITNLHVKHLGMNKTNWTARMNKTDFVMDCPRQEMELNTFSSNP
jgi:hypothetical protein